MPVPEITGWFRGRAGTIATRVPEPGTNPISLIADEMAYFRENEFGAAMKTDGSGGSAVPGMLGNETDPPLIAGMGESKGGT